MLGDQAPHLVAGELAGKSKEARAIDAAVAQLALRAEAANAFEQLSVSQEEVRQ